MVDLDFFFRPKSIAVLGASSKAGKIGYEVLKNIIDAGYEYEIYPINRSADEILGKNAFKSILDVPSNVDLAVYALPAKYAPQTVLECGKKQVKGIVIISGGFKELKGEGIELERQTLENARKNNIRIIGPNCVGVLSPKGNFDTFFQPRYAMMRPKPGNISVLTQSGTFGLSILEWLAEEDLGVAKFVSYGNKADVDEIDMLRYLENDPETEIIALYVEGLKYGRHFAELAKKISKTKPIIMLKAGRTAKGAKAAHSHTGSIAGNDAVFFGAMKQSGVIVVPEIDEMLDIIRLLVLQPKPKGNRVAMVTNGVGPCVIAVDEIEMTKYLSLAEFKEESIEKLKSQLPDYCVFSNPLDLTGSAQASWYGHSLQIIKADENVDIIMPFFVFQDAPLSESIEELHEIMKKINDKEKTLVCIATGGEFTKIQIKRLRENGIPSVFPAKRAIEALNKVIWYSNYLEKTKE